MNNTYFIDLDKLRPTHFYLSKNKFDEVEKHFANHLLEDYPPMPVINLGTKMLLAGGHHYAYSQRLQFDSYIKKTKDAQFLSFSLFNQIIAFAFCRKLYDNTVEIYLLGTHNRMLHTNIASKIINCIKRHARSINRDYIAVKVPIITDVENDIIKQYDFYKKQGFSDIENL